MTNSLLNILVTGGDGQVAQALNHHPLSKQFQLRFYARNLLDVTQANAIMAAILINQPDIIINTAAYTAVDKAEEEKSRALQVNQEGAKQLAIACEKNNIHLIHLSTDYIFDGNKHLPYQEDELANPINFYGESKWLGEKEIKAHASRYTILRVSGVFSEYGNNFLKTMLRLSKEKNEIRVVADQITCPTYAGDIASAILTIAKSPKSGIYHYCSAPPTSWHEFASAIMKEANSSTRIRAITTADYPTAAKRPSYSVLDCSRIKQDFQIEQPSWLTGIQSTIQGLNT